MTTDSNAQGPEQSGQEKAYWLDRKENVEKIVWAVYAVCGFLFAIDIFVEKHGKGPFAIDHWYAFYGIYGFVACGRACPGGKTAPSFADAGRGLLRWVN